MPYVAQAKMKVGEDWIHPLDEVPPDQERLDYMIENNLVKLVADPADVKKKPKSKKTGE